MKKYLLIALILLTQLLQAQRATINFNKDWKFNLGNDSLAVNSNYDDTKWRSLNLPHDWSIEGNFSKEHPATNQGGALPGGIGWYRKTFTLPAADQNKNVSIEFDGVYRNSEVWINGHYLGKRPYGYISFSYDLTRYLRPGNEKNVIVVKVDNSQQPNSRWYSGSGIYRDVRLTCRNVISFEQLPFYTTGLFTPEHGQWKKYEYADTGVIYGDVHMGTIAISNFSHKNEKVQIEFLIKDANGQLLNSCKYTVRADTGWGSLIRFDRTDGLWGVPKPILWSPENPYLYKAIAKIYFENKMVDEVTTSIGFRSTEFKTDKGFFLNEQHYKIKGVCMHHDLGALGAAFNIAAAKRQLQLLKAMGCNAIRTAHNPPAPQFLDLCDEMGFLVMDEAFDMWNKKKNKFDYSKDFKAWYATDLADMVQRDRNHPSVFMWSIGNEIREQFDSAAVNFTKELVSIVKANDPTRPVTSAMTETVFAKNFIAQSNALDVLGFNYKDYDYDSLPQRFAGQKLIASETVSGLATRGVYQFTSDTDRIWPPNYKVQDTFKANKDLTCAAYDNTYAYWGNTHEKAWAAVKKRDFIAGTFVWSGFDFIGEPVPYQWPARSSYYGIIDLAGFPKDVYYMYQSEWTTKPVLHIFPHWNWNKGDTVDVWAYYNNADEVELFLNGRSLGSRKKTGEALHVMWRVPYEPGIVKAVAKKNGATVLVKQIQTAGAPAKIVLGTDKNVLKANSDDLAFITATIVDSKGNIVPGAQNLLQFSIAGNAGIAATDNGYEADTVSFGSTKRTAWKGMALAIIKTGAKKGNSTLTVRSAGLPAASIRLKIAD
ncbi:sugar-binding domain-containing protein [Ferruginibacter sp.]